MSRPKHSKETSFEYLKRTIKKANKTECQLWPFGLDSNGYGLLSYCPEPLQPRLRVNEKAHRLAYFLKYHSWPKPLGRHTCDIPACFNPLHIIPGTDADNSADRVARGRNGDLRGSKNPASKLTEEIVRDVRGRALTQEIGEIASELHLARHTVGRAVRGETWKHVDGAVESTDHYAWLCRAIAEHGSNSACLIWPFATKRQGSPHVKVDGIKFPIHHIAYKLVHGELPRPTGRRICNDDMCVNPYHVYPAKKHSVRTPSPGETNPAAKLSWPKVRQIRVLGEQGLSQQSIADQYGVSQRMVSCILRGTHWREPAQDVDNKRLIKIPVTCPQVRRSRKLNRALEPGR